MMNNMTMELVYNPETKKVEVEFIGIPKKLLPKGSKYISSSWDNRVISLEDARKIIEILLKGKGLDNE